MSTPLDDSLLHHSRQVCPSDHVLVRAGQPVVMAGTERRLTSRPVVQPTRFDDRRPDATATEEGLGLQLPEEDRAVW